MMTNHFSFMSSIINIMFLIVQICNRLSSLWRYYDLHSYAHVCRKPIPLLKVFILFSLPYFHSLHIYDDKLQIRIRDFHIRHNRAIHSGIASILIAFYEMLNVRSVKVLKRISMNIYYNSLGYLNSVTIFKERNHSYYFLWIWPWYFFGIISLSGVICRNK